MRKPVKSGGLKRAGGHGNVEGEIDMGLRGAVGHQTVTRLDAPRTRKVVLFGSRQARKSINYTSTSRATPDNSIPTGNRRPDGHGRQEHAHLEQVEMQLGTRPAPYSAQLQRLELRPQLTYPCMFPGGSDAVTSQPGHRH